MRGEVEKAKSRALSQRVIPTRAWKPGIDQFKLQLNKKFFALFFTHFGGVLLSWVSNFLGLLYYTLGI